MGAGVVRWRRCRRLSLLGFEEGQTGWILFANLEERFLLSTMGWRWVVATYEEDLRYE